jgi:iron complex transport system substrate-binding protein
LRRGADRDVLRAIVRVVVVLSIVVSGAATPALAATPTVEDPTAVVGGPAAPQTTQTTANECTYPFTSEDATGTNVTIEAPPERVVTLGPSAAQTMWEFGEARDKVVGVNPNSDYLDGAETRPSVFDIGPFGPELTPNVSKVVERDPDVVLAPNIIPNKSVEALRAEGLTVYRFETATDVEFIYRKTRLTGRLVDECDAADRRTAELRDQVRTIRRATADVEEPLVFHYFGPGFGDFPPATPGRDTFIDEIYNVSGAENLGARFGSGYPAYESEQVVDADPAWITYSSDYSSVPDTYASTTALETNQTVQLNANHLYQPAPRIVVAMTTLVRALHPERYRRAQLGLLAEEVNETDTWERPYADADPVYSTVEDDAAVLRVQNGEPPTTRWTVSSEFDPNSSVRLTELAVSSREPNPIYTVRVRNATADAPPLPENATLLAAYEPNTEDLFARPTGAAYTLRVPLERVGDDTTRLSLYRRTGDGWTALDAERSLNETDQTVTIAASSDVLTGFAVGVAPAPTATEPSTPDQPTPTAVPTASLTPTATATPSPTATPAPSPTATATPSSTPSAGGAPGFGPVAALAALLAGALLALQRR